jgi:hypothetical protein
MFPRLRKTRDLRHRNSRLIERGDARDWARAAARRRIARSLRESLEHEQDDREVLACAE